MADNIKNVDELSGLLQLVSFKIGNEEFGIDILKVQEINKMVPITKMPNTPEFIEGVINLRGRIIPVVDMRIRLGLGKQQHNKSTRIIVVDIEGKTIGFVVDAVSEVLRIPASITEAPPELTSGINSDFITAVGKLDDRLLILLDLDKVLKTSEKELILS
ncbi:MAG: chemotaxis protein CheW [Bacteroidota bacterium]|nr:chemotaxis protein CheW [Bacteroidota bacterium]